MEQLLQWDSTLLLWINGHHTAFWDQVMWYVSQSWLWIPLYVWMIYLIWKTAKRSSLEFKGISNRKNLSLFVIVLLATACIGAAAGLSDFVTSGILKKIICRPRPTHSDLAPLLHLVNGYTGGHYGFPSSHAANCWAVATSFCIILKTLSQKPLKDMWLPFVIAVLYALINCYSRMYLGVHYPLDILCGTLIGVLFGWLAAEGFKKFKSLRV